MAEIVKGVAAIPTSSHPIVETKNFESFFTIFSIFIKSSHIQEAQDTVNTRLVG